MPADYLIEADDLKNFTAEIFKQAGIATPHAIDAADVLVWANLHGVDTHGVRNLKKNYIDALAAGRINPEPAFRVEHETLISARADGDGGLGLAAACWAMRQAIAKAQQSGIGLVTMRNSYHFGAAGYYTAMSLPYDMIGLSMTGYLHAQGSESGVPPTFGAQPMFSTNPLSISFPTHREPPFLLDMATSVVAYNRIEMMMQAGQSIPLGWGLDADRQPTTDPAAVRHVLPLGGTRERGSHKGYGLALMVQVLCSVLSGGWSKEYADGTTTDNRYSQENSAHFFGAIDVNAFRPVDEFKEGMDAMIDAIHSSEPVPGRERVYVPGEIEYETNQKRLEEGIPLPDTVVADLRTLSKEYGVPLDL